MTLRFKGLLAVAAGMFYTFQVAAISRQQLAQYAAVLKGKKQAELKAALHDLINPKKVLSYGSGSGKTWSGFYQTDRDPRTNECYNRYSSKKFYFTNGNTNSAISGMNIEHSFPKSWWGGSSNNAYKDLYNLYPSDSQANSSKSNYVMGHVTVNPKLDAGEGYDIVGKGYAGDKLVNMWEPGDRFKGEFSRSYMYMATTYSHFSWESEGLNQLTTGDYPTLKQWAYDLYIQWGHADKVDSLEVARNNAVYAIQLNRNLYIDFPFLADYVWGDSVDVAFDPYTSISTASDDDRYYGSAIIPVNPDTPDPETPDEPEEPEPGLYEFELADELPLSTMRCLIVAQGKNGPIAALPVRVSSSKGYNYLYGKSVTDIDNVITLDTDTLAFTFEPAEDGWHIIDAKGRYYYQDAAYNTFTPATDASKADIWLVTFQADGTVRISASDSGNTFAYALQYSSFGNYPADGLPTQSSAPKLYIERTGDGTSDGIIAPDADVRHADDPYFYDLTGRRYLQPTQPGIYIHRGRKIVR